MASNAYSVPPPPSYASTPAKPVYGATESSTSREPLLGNAPRDAWAEGDLERDEMDDGYKLGTPVNQCSQEVRHAFVRKVYTILFCQVLFSAIVGGVMSIDSVTDWVRNNNWLVVTSMIGSLVSMGLVYWKRHSHPLNLVFLFLFTLLEAITIGSVVTYYNQTVVLQALVITTFVFGGLTLFTIQSKYDFSSMGSWLFGALLVFFGTSVVGVFMPFSRVTDMLMAGAGVVLFSGYIIYDSYLIMNRYSPDEWVMASLSLYLDGVNLFLQILRLLTDLNRSD